MLLIRSVVVRIAPHGIEPLTRTIGIVAQVIGWEDQACRDIHTWYRCRCYSCSNAGAIHTQKCGIGTRALWGCVSGNQIPPSARSSTCESIDSADTGIDNGLSCKGGVDPAVVRASTGGSHL